MQRSDGLAAGEAGVEFVPVFDSLFSQVPAEVDVAAFVAADEVDQADAGVFQFAADVVEFRQEAIEPFFVGN